MRILFFLRLFWMNGATMKVYVVIDYDCIEYAGTSKKAAQSKVKGDGCVWVWEDGKRVGWLKWDYASKSWKMS
jgi:hypothetical protein